MSVQFASPHIFGNFRNMIIDVCVNRLSMHLFLYKSDSKRRVLMGGRVTDKYDVNKFSDLTIVHDTIRVVGFTTKSLHFLKCTFEHEQLCHYIKTQILAVQGKVAQI